MKKQTRILLLLLALALSLSAFASCGKPSGEKDTTSPPEEVTTADPGVPMKAFFNKNDDNIKIVFASGSGSNARSSDVSTLVSAINQRFGLNLRSATDKTTKENSGNKEILIGKTNRETSANAAKDLAASDYAVVLSGNQLAIVGGSEEATARAIKYFISSYLVGEGDELLLPEGLNYRWVFSVEAASAIEVAKTYAVLFGEGGADTEKSAARSFAAKLASATGETVSAKAEITVPNGGKYSDTDCVVAGREVLIGHTNRRETNQILAKLGPLDWTCRAVGEKIVLVGTTADGTVQAVNYFISALCDGGIRSLSDLDHTYLLSDALTNENSPAADYNAFVPVWAGSFTVPAWMNSQNEKIYAITAPDARNMSATLGGDGMNYPAYSLEALTSAVKAGADLLIINVYATKDGIAVTAPGTALKLYTDAAQFAGKQGFPLTTDLGDWTYEQLRALHYVNNKGEVTRSGICSLYEAIRLAHGRCLLSFLYPSGDQTETVRSLLEVMDAFDCYYEPDVTGASMVQPKLLRTLRAWRNEGTTASSLEATLKRYEDNLKLGNHWMRRLFHNDRVLRRGLTDPFDPVNLRAWFDQGYNFFYATDIVSYCAYIATQDSAFVNEDFRPRTNDFTIAKSALGGRILILSDTHYYPINNSIGYTADEKMELVVAQIRKEYYDRGVDAVVIVGDLSTDNDYYHMNGNAIPAGAELYDTVERNGKTFKYYRTSKDGAYTGYYCQVLQNGTVVNTGYLSPTNYGKDYYQIAQTQYLAPLSAELNGLPIYVLPGNHDSDIDHRWFTTFGYERQFTAQVKDTLLVCLDTFNDADEEDENTIAMSGHGGDYRPVDFTYLKAELAKYPAGTSGVSRILIFAHYLSNADKEGINALAAKDSRILVAYDGHTHQYDVQPYSSAYFINDGDVSYTAMPDESGGWSFDGTGKRFGYLDVRTVWGYMLFEWGNDANGTPVEVTYRMLFGAHFTPYNIPGGYDVPEMKQDDIIVSRS